MAILVLREPLLAILWPNFLALTLPGINTAGLFTAGLFTAGKNMAEFPKIRQIIPAVNIPRHKYPFKIVSNFDKCIVFSVFFVEFKSNKSVK